MEAEKPGHWHNAHLREAWSFEREIYLSLGMGNLVSEMDALLNDRRAGIDEPKTFRRDLLSIHKRLRDESARVVDERGGAPAAPVRRYVEWAKKKDDQRVARAAADVNTPRGLLYTGFLLCAQVVTRDWMLTSAVPYLPDITKAVGPEHLDALESPKIELRMRAFAKATLATMETYYKPLAQMVWTLSAQMLGETKSLPTTLGTLMRQSEEFWDAFEAREGTDVLIRPRDFLYWDGLDVRNGAGHPNGIDFEPDTARLIVHDKRKGEIRLTEAQLKERLHGVFIRARTMHMAVLYVTGRVNIKLRAMRDEEAAEAAPEGTDDQRHQPK